MVHTLRGESKTNKKMQRQIIAIKIYVPCLRYGDDPSACHLTYVSCSQNMDTFPYFFNLNIFMFGLFQHMFLETNKICKGKISAVVVDKVSPNFAC